VSQADNGRCPGLSSHDARQHYGDGSVIPTVSEKNLTPPNDLHSLRLVLILNPPLPFFDIQAGFDVILDTWGKAGKNKLLFFPFFPNRITLKGLWKRITERR